jgi:hypothetical protein
MLNKLKIKHYESLRKTALGVLVNIIVPPLAVIAFAIGVIGILLTPFLFFVPKRLLPVPNPYKSKKMISKLERIGSFLTTALKMAAQGAFLFLTTPYFWLIKTPVEIILTIKTGFPHIPSIEKNLIPQATATLAKYKYENHDFLHELIAVARELHNECIPFDGLLPSDFREKESALFKKAVASTPDGEIPAQDGEQRRLFEAYIDFINHSLLTKPDVEVEAVKKSSVKPVTT